MLSECEDERVTADMVKNKLYSNYKDMDDSVHQYTADLINLVRKFSCKKNETPSIYTGVVSRQVRNIMVQKYNTRFNTVNVSINTSQKNKGENMAIDLTAGSVYYLFKPNYKMLKNASKTEEFTSYDSTTKSQTAKEMIFRKFLQVGKIKRIMKEQYLEPNWTFRFVDQYNLK
jgi:hypothetical protein